LGVAAVGDYAYVADNYAGLRVISVSDPANPAEVGSYNTPGSASGVAVVDSHAYVADGDSGLRVISVSDPAHPAEVGCCYTPSSALGVAVVGNYVYVADNYAGLRVISVSDRANPTEVGFYVTPGSAYAVAVAGDYAYVADCNAGLQIYQFYGAGIEEGKTPCAVRHTSYAGPTVVRGILELPRGSDFPVVKSRGLETSPTFLLDISGRKVLDLHAGPNDVSRLTSGVYFLHSSPETRHSSIVKVVITR
jgi:hypothetical protein